MSRQINQPINQVKLTNVAVVRLNKAGKRFEIACYRNKVMDYRSGLETDLSEVLQTDRIFTNVSKGQFANVKDLEKAFGTRDQEAIAKIILEQNDKQQSNLQISDLERAQSIKDTLSQISTWVSANCVHSDGSNRPFTASQIRHALGKSYTVHPHKAIKKQCLDAVKFLKTVIPIERAKMEIQLQYPNLNQEQVQAALATHAYRTVRQTTSTEKDSECVWVVQVDPSLYRDLSDLMSQMDGSLEIFEQVVMTQQGDMGLEEQLEMNNQQLLKQKDQDSQPLAPNQISAEKDADSEVEDLVERLQNIRDHGNQDSLKNQSDKDDSEDDTPLLLTRKQQKKNRKKNKRAKRREQEDEDERLQGEEHGETPGTFTIESPGESMPTNTTSDASNSNNQSNSGEDVKSCNTCGGAFASASDYRAHFRSDWHRFNQKLKLKGVAAVTEEEFLLCDADSFFNNNL